MKPLLSVRNLSVTLDQNPLIQDVSFELSENETLVVLGPNGAGKTILMRTLLGLLPPKAKVTGQISWREGIRLGYVPQRVPMNKELPVSVLDFFELKGIRAPVASKLLKQVGLEAEAILQKQLGLLSGGQFQRVLIAWAMAKDPEVLLFDEPTAGVDLTGEDAIQRLIEQTRQQRNFAIILVTHDLSTVYRDATRVICLNQKNFCYGPPSEVLSPEVLERIYGKKLKYVGHSHD